MDEHKMGTTQKEVAADCLGTWDCLKPCDRTPGRGGGQSSRAAGFLSPLQRAGGGAHAAAQAPKPGLGALLPPGASAGGSQSEGKW